ncbi:MAG TPA: AAA family ATPase [Methanosphaera sp.]|nr:AAA family ATPase [Methanosphaera sp.]
MLRDFKLKIENFGPINKADLDISKINIIAGKNASGKTTMSKLIYCILTAFSTDGEYLAYESMKDRFNSLIEESLKIHYSETTKITDILSIQIDLARENNSNMKTIEESYDKLESIIESAEDFENKKYILSMIKNDRKTLKGISSPEFNHDLLFNLFRNEFGGDEQILDNYNDSMIKIYNNENNPFEYKIKIENAINITLKSELKNLTTNREAIYIETPYFLDFHHLINETRFFRQIPYHQLLLSNKLNDQSRKNDILDEKHNAPIINFQNKLNKLVNGSLKKNGNDLFAFKQNGKSFDLQNTSTGLKSIGILQLLLENRKLKENSYLIMDEPEVHLHPEWQVKLAKILVLLVKDLNVNLFINSHSPQFIEAIEVYSIKYSLRDETNFYLTKKDENIEKYNVEKIEYDNLYEIYNNLGDPYDMIDEVRGENIANQL